LHPPTRLKDRVQALVDKGNTQAANAPDEDIATTIADATAKDAMVVYGQICGALTQK
jgi:hypothetical protein